LFVFFEHAVNIFFENFLNNKNNDSVYYQQCLAFINPNCRSTHTPCHENSDLIWTLGAVERTVVCELKMVLCGHFCSLFHYENFGRFCSREVS